MECYARRFASFLLIVLMTLTTVGAAPLPALEVFMLPRMANITPERVLSGEFRDQFVRIPSGEMPIMGRQPRWLMLVAHRDFPPGPAPQLLMTQPLKRSIEVWRPGDRTPVRRATFGPHADINHSSQFHVVPLPQGLKRGEVIYLRVLAVDRRLSSFRIESAAYVHRMDISHARSRTFILTSLGIVSLLAFGLWLALKQSGYAYLALTLALQAITLTFEGGEIPDSDWLRPWAEDIRTNIVLNTATALATLRFLMFFLSIPSMQPRIAKVLNVCSAIFLVIIAIAPIHVSHATVTIGNVVLLIAIVVFAKAIVRAIQLKQREAFFLLIAWMPFMAALAAKIGGMEGWWQISEWIEFGYPLSMSVGGLGLILGMTDKLHQLRRDHETVRHRANHDGLTGVMTRAALEEALNDSAERARKSGDPLSVVFFDIDHFKQINDQYGHAVGDEVLRIVALRTRNRLRPFDVFGRYGGDEMLIGLVGAPIEQALSIAEHIRKGVSDSPVTVESQQLTVGLSLGVAQLREGETLDMLLRRADAALYASKADGRGRVTAHAMNLQSSAR